MIGGNALKANTKPAGPSTFELSSFSDLSPR